jgi:hypothetical protein
MNSASDDEVEEIADFLGLPVYVVRGMRDDEIDELIKAEFRKRGIPIDEFLAYVDRLLRDKP